MIVSKAQGQLLDTVGVDLHSSFFSHGQLNFALPRVIDMSRLCVSLQEEGDGMTQNAVYPEVIIQEAFGNG